MIRFSNNVIDYNKYFNTYNFNYPVEKPETETTGIIDREHYTNIQPTYNFYNLFDTLANSSNFINHR